MFSHAQRAEENDESDFINYEQAETHRVITGTSGRESGPDTHTHVRDKEVSLFDPTCKRGRMGERP